jgi:hypothetical protein
MSRQSSDASIEHESTDIPEETNPRGHDARPDPSVPLASGPSEQEALPPRSDKTHANADETSPTANAKFLADEFDIPERRAAAVVVRPGTSDDEIASLAAEVYQQRQHDDALAGVPTPREDQRDLRQDADESALKPVDHRPNRRTGGG